jgi:HTH-type transcriptional regulator/antitoxin HigA
MVDEKKVPAIVVPPGRIIQREIDARGWSQKDLAVILSRPSQAVNEIINGVKQITPETAIELGAAFGTSSELWMNLETKYRLWLAHQAKNEDAIAKRSRIFSLTPIREIQKRGWINPSLPLEDLEPELCRFLGIDSLETPFRMAASFRCSTKKQPDPPSQFAWLKRVEHLARDKRTGTYDRENLEKSLPELLAFAERDRDIRAIPEWLAEAGVALELVYHLPKTYIDGAAFFLDGKPVIALSLRYNRLDSFWFTLCHELAHILYGNGHSFLDEDIYDTESELQEGTIAEEERMTNEKACNWLLEPEAYNEFVQITTPYFSKKAVLDFARQQKRHPSIVVGRLQHEKRIPPQNLNNFNGKPTSLLMDYIDR